MMSGQSISAIGAWDNAAELPASVPTFAHHLQAVGYRTILAGKMHFVGPDQLHGFEERLTTDVYPADFAWTPDWSRPAERMEKWYHNMDPLAEAGPAVATHQIDYDEEVGYTARRKLLDLARDHGQRLGNGWVVVRRPTHSDIAHSIGTSRETISRLINEFEEGFGLVNKGKFTYIREALLG